MRTQGRVTYVALVTATYAGACAKRPSAPLDAALELDTAVSQDASDASALVVPPWLLAIENSGTDSNKHRLLRIAVDEAEFGQTREICSDVTLPAGVPTSNIISSLTFNQGRLRATGRVIEQGDTMFEIDPCTCTASVIGAYGGTSGFGGIPGITSIGAAMFGIDTVSDLVTRIDVNTARSTPLAPLPGDWGTAGLTWSGPQRNSLLAISGATDTLVEFDPATGTVRGTPLALDYDFGSVGMEYHPGQDRLYACSSTGHLLVVDAVNGHVTVGPLLFAPCNNLAAPFGRVDCIQ